MNRGIVFIVTARITGVFDYDTMCKVFKVKSIILVGIKPSFVITEAPMIECTIN